MDKTQIKQTYEVFSKLQFATLNKYIKGIQLLYIALIKNQWWIFTMNDEYLQWMMNIHNQWWIFTFNDEYSQSMMNMTINDEYSQTIFTWRRNRYSIEATTHLWIISLACVITLIISYLIMCKWPPVRVISTVAFTVILKKRSLKSNITCL